MPSMRFAQPRGVAGPIRAFNAATRAALHVCLAAEPAGAQVPSFEPPITGFVVGVEVGVLVATLCEVRAPANYALALGVGGAAGLGFGIWAGGLRDEPGAGLVMRAGALGLAIPAAVLLWAAVAEPPSPLASEDSSALARSPGVGKQKEKTQ